MTPKVKRCRALVANDPSPIAMGEGRVRAAPELAEANQEAALVIGVGPHPRPLPLRQERGLARGFFGLEPSE